MNSMAPATKHGVFMADHSAIETFSVGVMQGKILFHTPVEGPITLHKLCTLAQGQGLTHLWVLPNAQIFNDRNMHFLDASDIDWNLLYTWEYEQDPEDVVNHLRSVYGWARAGRDRHGFYIIFLGPWAAWHWARKTDITPHQVLWIVAHLEHELHIPISGSPGYTGKKYLESLHPKHKEWLNSPEMDLTALPFNQSAKSLAWTRIPTEEELSKPFVVKLDKNSAFPRGGVEYLFGIETPEQVSGGQAQTIYQNSKGRIPGIWRVTARPANSNPFLPPLLWDRAEWIVTPLLKRAIETQWEVEIHEAWIFREHAHVFKAWAENLWAMRCKYAESDARRAAIKQVLTDTVGVYRSRKLEGNAGKPEEDTQVFKRRPDWFAQFVGGTRAIMHQNAESFVKKLGMYPILMHIDCILYCSDKPLAELLPDNRETLGAYKHVWELPMTAEVRAILASPTNSVKKLQALNMLAGETGEL